MVSALAPGQQDVIFIIVNIPYEIKRGPVMDIPAGKVADPQQADIETALLRFLPDQNAVLIDRKAGPGIVFVCAFDKLGLAVRDLIVTFDAPGVLEGV